MINNWYVITGRPGSGLTTTINTLTHLGYAAVPEAARTLIDEDAAAGKTTEQTRADEAAFSARILKRKRILEATIPKQQLTFFDRAIPDSVGYGNVFGGDHQRFNQVAFESAYRGVFFLEPLRYENDYARTESERVAHDLGQAILAAYQELGYPITIVPLMPPRERADFILHSTSAQKHVYLAGCAILTSQGLLLLQRASSGNYELPGGKIKPEETAAQAAKREIYEELGCDVDVMRPIGHTRFAQAETTYHYQWFAATIINGQTPYNGEPATYRRLSAIPLEDLTRHPLSSNMQHFAARFRQSQSPLLVSR